MIKRSVQVEDKAVVNIYDPNRGAPQCLRQKLIDTEEKIDSSTKIVEEVNPHIH